MHLLIRLTLLALVTGAATLRGATRSESLSTGWQFSRGDLTVAEAQAAQPGQWEPVRVPHDWAIAGPFDPEAHGGTGKLPWEGEGWYRRSFTLPAEDAGKRVYFDFDGVMAFPRVYINGELAGEWDYGYSPFRIDATEHVRWGADNTILVHVDTRRWGSRWYPGAGIYREVRLTVTEPVHRAHWGTRIWADGDELAGRAPTTAWVETTIENHLEEPQTVELHLALLAPDGALVAEQQQSHSIPAGSPSTLRHHFTVEEPLRWDIEHPHRYTVRTTLMQDGQPIEEREDRFGFRTFAFTADDGFHLNGRRVQLKGVNLHHDLGPLGAAFNRRAAQRQLEIMRDMGVNAIRTSHNAPAAAVLELCDEMGLLVWDEVFDKWERTAGRPDLEPPLAPFGHRHIGNVVRRDRNHPSVVVWSTGNELTGSPSDDGINPERVALMAGFVRAHDPTRPVAMGSHIPGLVNGENFAALDLTGWNYARRYARYREVWPSRPIVYSESASTVSTRGYYDPQLPDTRTDWEETPQVSSYDLHSAAWSDVPDAEFRLMEEDRFVAGEFVWTGFDYLGEPTPYDAEARSSYFGIADLCGFPKDRYWLYRSHWLPDQSTVHLLPHWNWEGRDGEPIPVFVYTNGDSAELFLNGRSLGLRRKGEVPDRSPNLAAAEGARASASSQSAEAGAARDTDYASGWQAATDDGSPWWQVDLGSVQPVRQIGIETLAGAKHYGYELRGSVDGREWTTLLTKATSEFPLWVAPKRVFHDLETEARYLRIVLTDLAEGQRFGLQEVLVHAEPAENDYYDVTYDYRLRWNAVPYEPGELRAVAYRDGERIGEAVVETVGAPVRLRLSPDRSEIAADGEDLAFITVEAVDREGRPHLLADATVSFSVTGVGELAAAGNGDPMSFDPLQDDSQPLFYGKALAIIRPREGSGGTIEVTARAEGLEPATLTLRSIAP